MFSGNSVIMRAIFCVVLFLYPMLGMAYDNTLLSCKWPNNTVEWWYNPKAQKFSAIDTISKAAMAWEEVSGVKFVYKGITTNDESNNNDGKFVVQWKNSSVVNKYCGIGKTPYAGCVNGIKKNNTGVCIDGRMILNLDRSVNSWQGLITHEFGHVVGLGHSRVWESVMAGPPYFSVYQGTEYQKTLRDDDIAGVRSLYPFNALPTIGSVVLNKSVVNRGGTLGITWTQTNQAWWAIGLMREDGSVVDTSNFLANGCPAGSGKSGCIAYLKPSSSTSATWSIPPLVPPGDYQVYVALWNAQEKSVKNISSIFRVQAPESPSMRGLNMSKYCQSKYGLSDGEGRIREAVLNQNNVYGWVCTDNIGISYSIDVFDACKVQHGAAWNGAAYTNYYDPYSWYCTNSSYATAVTSVTSLNAVLGQKTTFTVNGRNLPSTLAFWLADCLSPAVVAGGTSTQRQFTCTPGYTTGSKSGEVKDKPNADPLGILLYNFTVNVTQATAPTAPSGLAAVAASSTQVSLSWNDNSSDETGFKLERKLISGAWGTVATLGANARSYSDTGLAANTGYVYRVYAYNANGNSGYSSEVSVTTASAASCTVQPISVGQAVSGTWASDCTSAKRTGSYARYYTFTLGSSTEVLMNLYSTSPDDNYMNLLDGNGTSGNIRKSDDDTGGNRDAKIQTTLAAGTYTIEVTPYRAGDAGAFTLTLAGAAPPTDNSPSFSGVNLPSSVVMPNKAYLTGMVSDDKGLSVVTVKVSGPKGNDLVALTENVSGTSKSLSGYYFDSSDSSYAGVSGTYYVTVFAKDTANQVAKTSTFTVTVSVAASCTVQPISVGQTVSGTWASDCTSAKRTGSYARYYTFTLGSSTEVLMNLYSTSPDDNYMNLLDGNGTSGNIRKSDDDTGGNRDAKIQTTLAAGTYTIEVTPYRAGDAGAFTLTLAGAAPPTDNSPSFSGVNLPSSVVMPNKAYLTGTVSDDKGLSVVTVKVSGPKGNNLVALTENVSGTSKSLSGYYFDSSDSSYAGVAGTYYVTVFAKDTANQVAQTSTFTVTVSASPAASVWMVNLNSGKCVDSYYGGTANGTKLIQYGCSTFSPDQYWQFTQLGDGNYNIVNKNSGKCLDVDGASSSDWARATISSCNTANSMKWELLSVGSGYYNLRNKNSGKCLDVYGGQTGDVVDIIQYSCHSGSSMRWKFQ